MTTVGSAHFRGAVASLGAASVLQATLSIALLPLATLFLTAAEFGTYALLMSGVALAVAISDGGSSLALPAYFGPADADARGRMIVTFVVVSGGLGLVVGLFLLSIWPLTGLITYTIGIAPSFSVWLSCAVLIPLRALSATATVIFSVSGRGSIIAAQLAVQAFATFTISVVALLLDLGLLSLFLGSITGQVFGLLVAGKALRPNLAHRPSERWLRLALAHAPTAGAAGLVDGARVFAENAIIARVSGLRDVAFYAHAKLYYGIGVAASNALAQNVWPISLDEAREPGRRFQVTGVLWDAIHLFVFLAGLAAVALGEEVIARLTNNVLTPAAAYLPWLFLLLLLNLSGRAAQALVYASGIGAEVTRVRIGLALLTLLALPIVASNIGGIGLTLGITGLIGASITEAIAYRLFVRWRAASLGVLPFQDFWVIIGSIGITLAASINYAADLSLLQRCMALVAAVCAVIVADWKRGGLVRAIAALRTSRA